MPISFSLPHRQGTVWWSLLAGTTLLLGLLAWLITTWLSGPRAPRVVANNISRNFRACLITGQPKTTAAHTAWAGMQDAARTMPINAQHLVVPTTSTAAALPYVNSLIERKCGLIISVDPALSAAITTAAQHNTHQQFITTGQHSPLPNVRYVPDPGRTTIENIVRKAAEAKARPTRK